MITIDVPGREIYSIENLVLDMNGTLAVDGIIPDEVLSRIRILSKNLNVYVITADTHGKLESQKEKIVAEIERVTPPDEMLQKAEFIESLGPSTCVAIGNGSNDVEMLRKARLGIVVLGGEGCAGDALIAADIIVRQPEDALDLLIYPKRTVATLRR